MAASMMRRCCFTFRFALPRIFGEIQLAQRPRSCIDWSWRDKLHQSSSVITLSHFSTMTSQMNDRKCWSCEAVAPPGVFLLCPSCKSVQPSDPSLNHFDIFRLERNYEVDLKDLEKRYKDLQKKLHPDLFSMKSKKEQEFSANQAAQVINAYQVLLKPVSRASYLLESLGIDVEKEGTVDDPEILMEVMEIQEAVSESSDDGCLNKIQDKARLRMKDFEKIYIHAMKKNDLNAAKEALQRMSYFERVIKNIIKKL